MTTPAEQEAERRYPDDKPRNAFVTVGREALRLGFTEGAEWEREQLRELLEAAREYREAEGAQVEATRKWVGRKAAQEATVAAANRLLAAAAALEEA